MEDLFGDIELLRGDPLLATVELDELTKAVVAPFDYKATGTEEFKPFLKPEMPGDWGVGVIVGGSGTGKSTLLREFGTPATRQWGSGSIASHFNTPEDAMEKLAAAGLSSVPDWVKPYGALSTGQKFRADLAISLGDGAVIDEFTSVVDRNVAKAASTALSRYVKKGKARRVVLATCHRDVLPWLEPDWIIDTDGGMAHFGARFRRPKLALSIHPCDHHVWGHFAQHHYLSAKLSPATQNYLCTIEDEPVGFVSMITNPAGTLKDAYRFHRIVVMPDWQGLGVGPVITEAVARYYTKNGKRVFLKTSHPRLGEYCDRSTAWRATSKNRKVRTDVSESARWPVSLGRLTFSHEYIGGAPIVIENLKVSQSA